MSKRLYSGTFVPYRKPRNEPKPKVDQERIDFLQVLSAEMQNIALAMDTLPDLGAITIRDANGTVWEVTVQRSDAPKLQCEVEDVG